MKSGASDVSTVNLEGNRRPNESKSDVSAVIRTSPSAHMRVFILSQRDCLIIPETPRCRLPREVGKDPEAPFRHLYSHRTRALRGALTIYQTVSLETV
jgi:hypothetical protein